jgi:general stress protein YciG
LVEIVAKTLKEGGNIMAGEMTVREAGRRGGNRVKERHGIEFFRMIGQKGGKTTSERHGREFYQRIGRKGGQKGGSRLRELIAQGKAEETKEESAG